MRVVTFDALGVPSLLYVFFTEILVVTGKAQFLTGGDEEIFVP